MKKRLLLVLFTLVSVHPSVVCADHLQAPFVASNIPLQGKRIKDYERLAPTRYANGFIVLTVLSGIVGPSLLGAAMGGAANYIEKHKLWPFYTRKRIFNKSVVGLAGAAGVIATSMACILMTTLLNSYSHAISRYNRDHLDPAVEAHNDALDPNNKVMIVRDEQGRRVLRMQDWLGFEIRYPFDEWREARENAIQEIRSGFFTRHLFGDENIELMYSTNDRLNELLRPNIKAARRG
jgi:hypothetical protein